jgi:Putative glycosyltransferase (DUF6716)
MAGASAPSVLAVADSDLYLTWSAATLAAMPAGWTRRQIVVRSPVTPSVTQLRAATGGDVEVLGLPRLLGLIERQRPDVVLLAATGPTVRTIAGQKRLRTARHRPVLVTGLPGISLPATPRAVEFRRGCDLLIVHSRRERRAFAELADQVDTDLAVGLARLPFLPPARSGDARRREEGDVVFAAQARVPPGRGQRRAVLEALAQVQPAGSAVVSLGATLGDERAHHEAFPFTLLWDELVAEGRVDRDAVRFVTDSAADTLASARACVTVSSTAVLEAMAAGSSVLVLSDFGVSPEMVNVVFEHSDCQGDLADLMAGRFRRPARAWLTDNYFHAESDSDWLDQIIRLLRARDKHGLPHGTAAAVVGDRRVAVRPNLRLILPGPAQAGIRRIRSRAAAARSRIRGERG